MRAAAAGPGGGWLNTYPDLVPLDAVDGVRPVAMFLARPGASRFSFVVLDLDGKGEGAAAVARHARVLSSLAEGLGIPVVPVASGPGGGVHLWMGSRGGVPARVVRRLALAARALCPSVDCAPLLNPAQGVVRPPGAAHRDGGCARLLAHGVEDAVRLLGEESAPPSSFVAFTELLEELTGRQPTDAEWASLAPNRGRLVGTDVACDGVPPSVVGRGPVVRRVVTDSGGRVRLDVPVRALGPRAAALLGRVPGPEEDHSALVHAPLRALAAAGWDLDRVARLVADSQASPALEWLRSARASGGGCRVPLGEAVAGRRLVRAWWLAVQDAARLPRGARAGAEEVEAAVAGLLGRMEAAGPSRWARPSGPADFAVLYAVAFLMLGANCLEVSVNVRRVAVLAGYSRQTASASLWRLVRDGWLVVVEEADLAAGRARRVGLAVSHVCPADRHHVCAVHALPTAVQEHLLALEPGAREIGFSAGLVPRAAHGDASAGGGPIRVAAADVFPGHHGSDRRRNAASAPACRTLLGSAGGALRAHVALTVAHNQGDPWDRIGHHAGRTLLRVRGGQGPVPRSELPAALGYVPVTIRRHLRGLAALGLIEFGRDEQGRAVVTATTRTLAQASRDTGTHGRTAVAAVAAAVDAARNRWWRAEITWCCLPLSGKRARGRRAPAEQHVIPGLDPTARAYPRDKRGQADHARAWNIEHARLDGDVLQAKAQYLADAGQVVDPGQLTTGTLADRTTSAA